MDLDDIIAGMREELKLLKLVIQKVEALIATGPKKPGGPPDGIVKVHPQLVRVSRACRRSRGQAGGVFRGARSKETG